MRWLLAACPDIPCVRGPVHDRHDRSRSSDPGENFNLNVTETSNGAVYALSSYLSQLLHTGPTYGNTP
eukprot:COSAG01_NODE_20407_length_955_cov_1.239486_2_plen_68_part_00